MRVLKAQTPDFVASKIISLLNQFHAGSSENHFDIMAEAIDLLLACTNDVLISCALCMI